MRLLERFKDEVVVVVSIWAADLNSTLPLPASQPTGVSNSVGSGTFVKGDNLTDTPRPAVFVYGSLGDDRHILNKPVDGAIRIQ